MLEFLMLTMLPIVTAYEHELNRKLLTRAQRKNGLHFKFDMDSILRADAATQAEVHYKAVRSGWMTPDEIRYVRNMPALPDGIGKYALVSQDLATLDYTVKDKPKVLMAALNKKEETPDGGDGSSDSGGKESGNPKPDALPAASGKQANRSLEEGYRKSETVHTR